MPLSINATGIALSATLVVLFVICAVVQMFAPSLQVTHMWISIFTGASLGSSTMWVQGIVANAVAGYLAGSIFSKAYNLSVNKK
jgi:hypothetical protein